MKELESHIWVDIKTEMNVKKKQEIEYVLEGKITPKKGHFLWELNEETGEIKKAEYKRTTIAFNATIGKDSEKLIVNADCIYIPALNAENVKRKYLKNKDQSFYYDKAAPANIKDITF